jgi:hypothetical protein
MGLGTGVTINVYVTDAHFTPFGDGVRASAADRAELARPRHWRARGEITSVWARWLVVFVMGLVRHKQESVLYPVAPVKCKVFQVTQSNQRVSSTLKLVRFDASNLVRVARRMQ